MWRWFKEVFEKRFGLTLMKKLEQFYALEMKSGKDAIPFICKVDATMHKLNA